MYDVIDKYFPDNKKVRYFKAPDKIHADHYIRYEFDGDTAIVSIGCDDGEVPFKVCHTPESLEETIKFIIYQ